MEVYVPWRDSWEYLPPLPLMDQEHRMELTRIISLTTGGVPLLYLLGGGYDLSNSVHTLTNNVCSLAWNSTSQSYYCAYGIQAPMGKLHLIYSYSCIVY